MCTFGFWGTRALGRCHVSGYPPCAGPGNDHALPASFPTAHLAQVPLCPFPWSLSCHFGSLVLSFHPSVRFLFVLKPGPNRQGRLEGSEGPWWPAQDSHGAWLLSSMCLQPWRLMLRWGYPAAPPPLVSALACYVFSKGL